MTYKPEIMPLNDFVKINQDAFTPYELWLTDELTDYLVAKRDLEKSYTSIVIDIDNDNPVYGFREDKIFLRFNGRFYIPTEDKNIKKLNMTPDQWVELFNEWFKEQEVEVVIEEKATDLIKFTAIISALEMPEEAPKAEEEKGTEEEGAPAEEETEEEGKEAGETPAETSEEAPTEETEEPATEETEEPAAEEPEEEEKAEPEESDDEELKEFEKALGL